MGDEATGEPTTTKYTDQLLHNTYSWTYSWTGVASAAPEI